MVRFLLPLLLATLALPAAEPVFTESFDGSGVNVTAGSLNEADGHGKVLHLQVPKGSANPGRIAGFTLPINKLRGKRVYFGAEVKTTSISERPNPWNGVKVMLVIDTPAGKEYPQPEIPVGSTEWQRYSTAAFIPQNATEATLVLGLEQVTGEAWFDNVQVTAVDPKPLPPPADPAAPIFRGHNLPRLRGAMAGLALTEDDVKYFATVWNGNLLRLQLFESAHKDRHLADYDTWLERQLQQIDQVLSWCEKYRVMAVVDLHSPPGGQAFSAGYITARGRIFTDPAAQTKFVEVWEQIAKRYKGRQIIWGFDLVNEPDDTMVSEDCLEWNDLAEKAARAVRKVDPERTLIIEPNQWGGPNGFENFRPLGLPGVVYSFHFYMPHAFTHQGISSNPAGLSYPGTIKGQVWDRAALEEAMRPAFEFARKYRVHLYTGEFSAIRNAPGDSAAKYLADVIDLLEKHGCDWSYHAYREWQGWSLEHSGPLDKAVQSDTPTDRQQVVVGWMSKNQKPGVSKTQR